MPLGFGLGLRLAPPLTQPATPLPVQDETTALLAAMSVQPSAARASAINRLIYRLKASGVFAKLDVLYLLAAHDEQASRLNIVAPATYTADATGHAPTFTADRGWQGNGTSTYLDTGFNTNTAVGRKFLTNDATLFCYSLTDAASATQADVGSGANTNLISRNLAGFVVARANNSATIAGPAVATSIGLSGWSRISSTDVLVFRGPEIVTVAQAGVSPSGANLRIGAASTSFSTRQIAVAGCGGSLSAAEIAWLHFACDQYLRHCGAI